MGLKRVDLGGPIRGPLHAIVVNDDQVPVRQPQEGALQVVGPVQQRQWRTAPIDGDLPQPVLRRSRRHGCPNGEPASVGRERPGTHAFRPLDLTGLDEVKEKDLEELLRVDLEGSLAEAHGVAEYYETFGDRVPEPLRAELAALKRRLQDAG